MFPPNASHTAVPLGLCVYPNSFQVKDFQAMLKHQEALVEFEMRRGLDEKLALCDIIQSDWSSPLSE